ncbi:MAG: peptide chain release factor N(5)-glutamine methyltransferase [Abditibacteriales bacterium]|nr:peptide chain release factor N(5)-glutamine methyltransferase [Abditibacteriales bacterium]MDW8365826.1 peptide chain release factor N(5)-glutamine methyltransferase [Abditibacteriales bacterium]
MSSWGNDSVTLTPDAIPQHGMIADALSWASSVLADSGIDEARLDAELLLAYALGVRRGELALRDEMAADELSRFVQLIQRRRQREPVPYIIGTQEFMGLTFRVTPDVLIPRPETERLVEATVEILRSPESRNGLRNGQNARRLADIGTGSGAIAISLARLLPDVQVYATDISEAALAVARENAERLGVRERVAFARGNCLQPLRQWGLQGQLQAMVSNPPYIPHSDVDSLPPEVSRYEPRIAWDGGADGLAFYRCLAAEAAEFLCPDGFIACEVGIHQSRAVCELFRRAGFARQEVIKDYGGIERVIIARGLGNEDVETIALCHCPIPRFPNAPHSRRPQP